MRRLPWLLLAAFLLAACSLAEDVTPPPQLATEQALPPGHPDTTPAASPTPVSPPADLEVDLKRGQAIFSDSCAPCHGAGGGGDGPLAPQSPVPPAALNDPSRSTTADPVAWYTLVTGGDLERFMPPFNSLSQEDRWQVVAYALTLAGHGLDLEEAEALYAARCAECHGPRGEGAQDGPSLANVEAALSRSGKWGEVIAGGVEGGMPAFEDLNEAQIQGLVAFARRLAFGQPPQVAEEPPTPEVTATATAAVTQGRVVGQVVNGTGGASPPGGLEVVLRGFDGQEEAVNLTTITDEDGRFVFDDVENAPGRIFLVTAEYQGVVYGSEVAHFVEGDLLDLPLQVYEVTDSTESLRVDRLHLVFEAPTEGRLQVIEVWVLSNLGDRTIQGSPDSPPLEIALPQGATQLQFEGGALGDRFVPTEGGFADRAPIRPGESVHQIVFAFMLPYDGKLEFRQPMEYPVDSAVFLTPEEGPELRGEGVEDQGVRTISGTNVRTFTAGPYGPGSELELTVRGKPWRAAAGEGGGRQGLALGLGALGLAVLGAALWLYRSSRQDEGLDVDAMELEGEEESAALAPEAQAQGDHQGEAEALVAQIAALDDAFEAGELAEEEYRARRQALKDRLKDLMRGGHD